MFLSHKLLSPISCSRCVVLVVLLLRSGFIDAFIVVLMFLVALHEWLLIVREVHFHKYRPSSSSSFGTAAAAVANASSSSVFDIEFTNHNETNNINTNSRRMIAWQL